MLAFSEPLGIVLGPDGNLWFTEVNNPECKAAVATLGGSPVEEKSKNSGWASLPAASRGKSRRGRTATSGLPSAPGPSTCGQGGADQPDDARSH